MEYRLRCQKREALQKEPGQLGQCLKREALHPLSGGAGGPGGDVVPHDLRKMMSFRLFHANEDLNVEGGVAVHKGDIFRVKHVRVKDGDDAHGEVIGLISDHGSKPHRDGHGVASQDWVTLRKPNSGDQWLVSPAQEVFPKLFTLFFEENFDEEGEILDGTLMCTVASLAGNLTSFCAGIDWPVRELWSKIYESEIEPVDHIVTILANKQMLDDGDVPLRDVLSMSSLRRGDYSSRGAIADSGSESDINCEVTGEFEYLPTDDEWF